jgi:hypothetical protein
MKKIDELQAARSRMRELEAASLNLWEALKLRYATYRLEFFKKYRTRDLTD